jgi:hypothetical protein
MSSYKDLSSEEQNIVKTYIYDINKEIAGKGLLGFDVKKLLPSKENKKKFSEQFQPSHQLCACVGCMQLANIFIDKSPDIKEEIIVESMKDLQSVKVS